MSNQDPEDTTFFREQMQGVKRLEKTGRVTSNSSPLTRRATRVEASPPSLRSPHKGRGEAQNDIFQFSDHLTETVTSASTLSFTQPAMPEKVLRDLRAGKIVQTRIIDLHGSTVLQARSELSQFLTSCIKQEQRCVRIIHGKGKLDIKEPVLKNHVNCWLRQHPAVLAFHSAIPRDGGTGAVYALLKRKKLIT
jgi:DNA-nicking Smr family endonuclease